MSNSTLYGVPICLFPTCRPYGSSENCRAVSCAILGPTICHCWDPTASCWGLAAFLIIHFTHTSENPLSTDDTSIRYLHLDTNVEFHSVCQINLFLFYVYLCFGFMYVYVTVSCFQEMELQTVVRFHVGAENCAKVH